MVVFNIGCIYWGVSLSVIICWIKFRQICLKLSYSLGGFSFWVSLGGFNWGLWPSRPGPFCLVYFVMGWDLALATTLRPFLSFISLTENIVAENNREQPEISEINKPAFSPETSKCDISLNTYPFDLISIQERTLETKFRPKYFPTDKRRNCRVFFWDLVMFFD